MNIDFHAGELPVGPPPEMRLSREAFLDAANEAGLWLAEERTFLPYQYFLASRRGERPQSATRPAAQPHAFTIGDLKGLMLEAPRTLVARAA